MPKNNSSVIAETSPEHQAYLNRIQRRKHAIWWTRVFILIAFFAFWELLAQWHWIDPFITSQPSRMVRTLMNLYSEGVLFHHIGITCLETAIGFVFGTLFGTLIAVILWWSDFLTRVAEPYLVILNSLPKIALAPIFITWIGAGSAAIISMALAISMIVTILEVLHGLLTVDQDQIKLVQTFGANKIQILTKVILPASFPAIINALKINVGLSWVGVIVGEFLVSKAGIGYLIVYGQQVFKLDLVMSSVFILSICATLMYQGVVWLEKILVKKPFESSVI
ncbi:MAG TPA: ABC transporter permease [Bacillota bacterium]|nr:ABC transporter permease [Bacillota bacterium]